MAFRVGQKVVCVNPKILVHPDKSSPALVLNGIYTIRQLGIFPDGQPGMTLNEIHGLPFPGNCFGEWAFHTTRFRPVIERKTDTGMAILRKLLDGNKIEEKV